MNRTASSQCPAKNYTGYRQDSANISFSAHGQTSILSLNLTQILDTNTVLLQIFPFQHSTLHQVQAQFGQQQSHCCRGNIASVCPNHAMIANGERLRLTDFITPFDHCILLNKGGTHLLLMNCSSTAAQETCCTLSLANQKWMT